MDDYGDESYAQTLPRRQERRSSPCPKGFSPHAPEVLSAASRAPRPFGAFPCFIFWPCKAFPSSSVC